MRRAGFLVAWAALATALAPLAAAAAQIPFRGFVDVVIGAIPVFVTVEGAGVATVNRHGAVGTLTSLELPSGVFTATALDFPGTGAVGQIRVTAANGPGSFPALTAAGGGGAMPLRGSLNLCLLTACSAASDVLVLPLDPVGAGGTARITGSVTITVLGMPWTKGTTTISTPAAVTILRGFAEGPLGNAGTTTLPGGMLELVTPAVIHTSLGSLGELTGYAAMRIEFVPEPATAALVGLGLALLAARGRRRGG